MATGTLKTWGPEHLQENLPWRSSGPTGEPPAPREEPTTHIAAPHPNPRLRPAAAVTPVDPAGPDRYRGRA
ncbi:MAG: hypothetical protein F7C81_01585, partial [Desulfurococcales archaeon]|nr:hypothetical protein [Desulfurococcales archaeon]